MALPLPVLLEKNYRKRTQLCGLALDTLRIWSSHNFLGQEELQCLPCVAVHWNVLTSNCPTANDFFFFLQHVIFLSWFIPLKDCLAKVMLFSTTEALQHAPVNDQQTWINFYLEYFCRNLVKASNCSLLLSEFCVSVYFTPTSQHLCCKVSLNFNSGFNTPSHS